MRFGRSAIFRFGALVFLLQVAGALLLLLTVHELTRRQIIVEAEARAENLRDSLLSGVRDGDLDALRARILANAAVGHASGSVMLLTDPAGRSLAGNLAEWPPSVPRATGSATAELFRIEGDVPEDMQLVTTRLKGGGHLLTGHVIESELRFTEVLEESMASALAVALALAAFAAWSSAKMLDRKIIATVDTAKAVSGGELDRRVPIEGGGDAFDALGVAINEMLERIAGLVGELKIATDGLAHDLRSPLTRLRSTLERALSRSDDDDARIAIARAIEEGDRLLAMLETALRISRAEAGLGREGFVEADVAEMVRDMVEVYGPVAEDLGLAIEADAPAALKGFVHRELLGQALANLIDNAMKYGGRKIEVSACSSGDGIIVTVADDGPGIPEAQRPEALRRFGRLDAARTKSGAGLGLSLAAVVARLHGSVLQLEDNGPGLRVRMLLGVAA
jgi:signal transduction histidine kinase